MRTFIALVLLLFLCFSCEKSGEGTTPDTSNIAPEGIHIFGQYTDGSTLHLLNGIEQLLPRDFTIPTDTEQFRIRFKTIYKSAENSFNYYFSEIDRNGRISNTYGYSDQEKEPIGELSGCVFLSQVSNDGSIPFGNCSDSGFIWDAIFNPDKNFYIDQNGELHIFTSGPKKLYLHDVLQDNTGRVHALFTNYSEQTGTNSPVRVEPDIYTIDGNRQEIDLSRVDPWFVNFDNEVLIHGRQITVSGSHHVEVVYENGLFIPKDYLPSNSRIEGAKIIDGKLVEFGFSGSTNSNQLNGFGFYTVDGEVNGQLDENVSFYLTDGLIHNNEVHLVGSTISKFTNEFRSIYLKDGVWQPYSDRDDLRIFKIMLVDE